MCRRMPAGVDHTNQHPKAFHAYENRETNPVHDGQAQS
jgi:hypothetical protein